MTQVRRRNEANKELNTFLLPTAVLTEKKSKGGGKVSL